MLAEWMNDRAFKAESAGLEEKAVISILEITVVDAKDYTTLSNNIVLL